LIDIRKIPIRTDDAGEALKHSQFCATVGRTDGLIIVAPKYNHSFPGLLKHVLDTNLKEYIYTAVGVCGVRARYWGLVAAAFRIGNRIVTILCLDVTNPRIKRFCNKQHTSVNEQL
jgi:NAD(P)H-dependent FMN reductase